jgi:hypothetical protein
MVKISPWQTFYQALPDGRSRIENAKLTSLHETEGGRILETTLKDKPAKILLLDKPFQLGGRIKSVGAAAFYLLRVHLRDLPGWPPAAACGEGQPTFPGALRCGLKSAIYKADGPDGTECVAYELECGGQVFRAWQAGCAGPLLQCVEATLAQDGLVGKKLADLQDMRLIGSD